LPTIINSIGFTSLQAQYLTIPIYIFGGIGFFSAAYFSDRTEQRAPFMLAYGLVTLTGYAILLGSKTPGVLYFACYLVLFGNYVFPGLNLIWINGNTAPHYKRATAIALNQTIGNIGGVIAGQIYLARERPYYKTGQSVSLTGCGLAWCGVLLLRWIFARENARRDKLVRDGAVDTGNGDRSIYFRYRL
jgi:MFS family permease